MDEGLVDLSLFDASPNDDHRFNVPEIPAFHRSNEERPLFGPSHGAPRQTGTFRTMKPLPPLPRRICIGVGPDPRRVGGPSRCILARMRRSRSDNLEERPFGQRNTLRQRRNVQPIPQLTLSEPQQQWREGLPASPMVWMPHEQMWLVVNEDGFAAYQSDAYEAVVYSAPPGYDGPPSARSEPSHEQTSPEHSPIRSQFLTLIQRREIAEDEMSPLFQEAIHGIDWRDCSEPDPLNGPATFYVERDWRSSTSSRELLQSAVGNINPRTSHAFCPGTTFQWEELGRAINRPRSAL